MQTIDKSKVKYLVRRKFPELDGLPALMGLQALNTGNQQNRLLRLSEKDEYERKLESISSKELEGMFSKEKKLEVQEIIEAAKRKERERFFSEPSANADTKHWAKLAYWTLEEAIALSFGKDPKVVNWETLKALKGQSDFVQRYENLREMAHRSKVAKQLTDPVTVGVYLAWAKRLEVDLPKPLLEEVKRAGIQVCDWQELCESQKEMIDSLTGKNAKFREIIEDKQGLIDGLVDRVKLLEARGEPTQEDSAVEFASSNTELALGEYWKQFSSTVKKAIDEYPAWRKTVNKVQKSANLNDWLVDVLGVSNREAEIIKKVLSDKYEELK